MKARYFAAAGFAALALAGCTAQGSAAPASSASASTGTIQADTSWAPIGMKHVGSLAWTWTPAAEFNCKSYQDGCFGITVATRDGCPGGIYIEVQVIEDGAVVDKANEITAGLGPGDVAKVVLSPPGGAAADAQAKLADLNCL